MNNINKEEIIKLIEFGFPLDIISFELDIPIEKLEEFKLYTEKLKQKSHIVPENNTSKHNTLEHTTSKYNIPEHSTTSYSSKANEIRKRYYELCSNSTNNARNKNLNTFAVTDIPNIINEIRSKDFSNLSLKERSNWLREIYKELEKSKDNTLMLEQAEELNDFFLKKKLEDIFRQKDCIAYYQKIREIIHTQLFRAIDLEVAKTNDIEELKKLYKKVNSDNNATYLSKNVIKNKINNRISQIKRSKCNRRS